MVNGAAMNSTPNVLLVAPTPRIAALIGARLTEVGLRVTLVKSFKAARRRLESLPSLLIAEVRLGEFNGLHLALRAQARGIRAIVLGEDDSVMRREAETLGADYLVDDCDTNRLGAALQAAGIQLQAGFGRAIPAA
jgi:DNA-binding response OmpR family regulator